MASGNFTVVFDACVLYSAPLRDFLMHLASSSGLFKAKWSDDIHKEWITNLEKNRPELKGKLNRTKELMNKAIPDALVDKSRYEKLIDGLYLPDHNDRHVLAVAISCGAELIITSNLKDFPSNNLNGYGISAMNPDYFISDLLDLDERAVVSCLYRQQIDDILNCLEKNGLSRSIIKLKKLCSRIKE